MERVEKVIKFFFGIILFTIIFNILLNFAANFFEAEGYYFSIAEAAITLSMGLLISCSASFICSEGYGNIDATYKWLAWVAIFGAFFLIATTTIVLSYTDKFDSYTWQKDLFVGLTYAVSALVCSLIKILELKGLEDNP